MSLGDAEHLQIRAMVGPSAWAVYDSLPNQPDLDVLATVHGGQLGLVAADVLDEVIIHTPVSVGGKVKIGPIEVPVGPDAGPEGWASRAARYRSEVGGALPGPTFTTWDEP